MILSTQQSARLRRKGAGRHQKGDDLMPSANVLLTDVDRRGRPTSWFRTMSTLYISRLVVVDRNSSYVDRIHNPPGRTTRFRSPLP
jgi:hypothetical protein